MSNSQPGSKSGVNHALLWTLMAHGVLVQITTGLVRITTSYRIVELHLDVIWYGIIPATFALFPIFLAVSVGRFIDRNHDAHAAMIGSGFMLVAVAGLRFADSPLTIMPFTALFGVGHLFLMAAHQMLCVRAAGEHNRDSVFGNFLMMTGVGQGLGPFIVGWVGGAARVPDTGFLFNIGIGVGAVSLAVALCLPPARNVAARKHDAAPMSVGKLLRIKGFLTVLTASVVTMSAQDLVVLYLPLLGVERGLGVSEVGIILTIRSIAAVVSRIGYAQMIMIVGRVRLTFLSMALAGGAFVTLAMPVPVLALQMASAVLGVGLGIATALSLTSVVELAPADVRATALSLRITGNRIGQASMPFMGSLLAASTGASGVLVVTGIALAASGLAVQIVRGRQGG
jgi:MFS family permease